MADPSSPTSPGDVSYGPDPSRSKDNRHVWDVDPGLTVKVQEGMGYLEFAVASGEFITVSADHADHIAEVLRSGARYSRRGGTR